MIKNTVVLVPFPFDDFSTTKVRPAICLTNKIGQFGHIVIAFITSQIPDDLEQSDMVLKINDKDFQQTGLKVSSVIRLHRIVTIPGHLIKRELGKITKSQEKELKQKLIRLFEL